MTAKAAQPVEHLITRWSMVKADETPLCGADPNSTGVVLHRTVFEHFATCPECLRVACTCVEKPSEENGMTHDANCRLRFRKASR